MSSICAFGESDQIARPAKPAKHYQTAVVSNQGVALTWDWFAQDVDDVVCSTLGINKSVIYSKFQNSGACFARQMVWSTIYYGARGGVSLPKIGLRYDRDHTTILSGLRRFHDVIERAHEKRSIYCTVCDALIKNGWDIDYVVIDTLREAR